MWRLAGRYSAVGIEMAVAVALGTFAGLWVDRHFNTAPLFFIVGLVVGIGAATRTVVQIIRTTKIDKL